LELSEVLIRKFGRMTLVSEVSEELIPRVGRVSQRL